MKLFAMTLSLLLTTSAFAGSFTKHETGHADWFIKTEQLKGDIFLTKVSNELTAKDVTAEEQKRIHYIYNRSLVIKEVFSGKINYTANDERSQESVLEYIKARNQFILSGQDINVLNVDIRLENVTCRYIGTTNQVLNCKGFYTVLSEVEFK